MTLKAMILLLAIIQLSHHKQSKKRWLTNYSNPNQQMLGNIQFDFSSNPFRQLGSGLPSYSLYPNVSSNSIIPDNPIMSLQNNPQILFQNDPFLQYTMLMTNPMMMYTNPKTMSTLGIFGGPLLHPFNQHVYDQQENANVQDHQNNANE